MSDVFSRDWGLALTLGIKCNTAPILTRLGYRYVSSPFDNMDSVDGLVQSGELIARRFEGYWENREKWLLRNDRAAGQTEIRAKIAWHEDYPGLYYPHFNERWFSNLSKDNLDRWVQDPNGRLDFVWEQFSSTFRERQERVVSLLDAGQSVLFVRVDERRQMRRLQARTFKNDANKFIDLLNAAYSGSDIALLYYYCPREGEPFPKNTSQITFIPIPESVVESEFVEKDIARLRLHPRERLAVD